MEVTKLLTAEQRILLTDFVKPFLNLFIDKVAERVKEMAETKEPRYYTRKQVCEVMGISLPTLNEYTKRGDLQSFKMSGRVLYNAWSVDEAIRTKSVYKGMKRR